MYSCEIVDTDLVTVGLLCRILTSFDEAKSHIIFFFLVKSM